MRLQLLLCLSLVVSVRSKVNLFAYINHIDPFFRNP